MEVEDSAVGNRAGISAVNFSGALLLLFPLGAIPFMLACLTQLSR